jgi:hypothetical protein
MANVGNLFVNVSGNTKGLTKALGTAKSELTKFDKQVGRPKGDFMRRARGRFNSQLNQRAAFEQEVTNMKALGVPRNPGNVEKIRARMGKKEAAARGQYRQAQRQQTIANMGASSRAMMTASFAAIGITISAVVSAFNIARKQAQSAENAVDAYKYAGPMGGRIAEEEVRKEMGALAAAQDPRISQRFLDKAKQERYEQETAIQSGSMGLNMNWNEISSEFGRAFAQAMGDIGVTGFLGGQGPSRNTGPVSTTGNTGGP